MASHVYYVTWHACDISGLTIKPSQSHISMSARHGGTRFGSYPSPVPARPCSIAPPLIQFLIGSDTVHHSVQSSCISGKILFRWTMPSVLQCDHADQPASGTFHPDPSIFSFKSFVYDSTVRTISFKYLPTYIHFLTCILLNDLYFPSLCVFISYQPAEAVRISWAFYLLISFDGLLRFLLCTEQPVLFEPDDSLVVC